jgi:cell cycle checkpoint protein
LVGKCRLSYWPGLPPTLISLHIARAYIPLSLFDEYTYTPEPQDPSATQESESGGEANTTFEIPLDTLMECLNIFGTAMSSFSQAYFDNRKKKRWRQEEGDEDEGGGRGRGKRGGAPKGNTTIDQFFSSSGEKKTGMRMTYAGAGHPLTLIL